MDGQQEERARRLVNQLERSIGGNCGLLVRAKTVVIRCVTHDPIDTPTPFDEIDLQNAISLGLLELHEVSGSLAWQWYQSKRKPAKSGDWIILSDGTRRKIDGFEKGITFYGKGDHGLVPRENLVPATNADPECWEIDNSR